MNLGVGLAKEGKKVLLIDGDPQGSLTASMGYPEPDEIPETLANIMMAVINEEEIHPEYAILHHDENVDLLPGNIELSGLEITLGNVMSREMILRDYVEMMREHYDYTGTIHAGHNAGGIIGEISFESGESKLVTVKKCYNTGKVSASYSQIGAITYGQNAVLVKSSYYLTGSCDNTLLVAGKEMTSDELKALAGTLGDAYLSGVEEYNDGYPILAWEESRIISYVVEDAIAELKEYKNSSDYRDAQKQELETVQNNAAASLNSAKTVAEVMDIVAEAKAAMDAIKTDAQLTEEENAPKPTVKSVKLSSSTCTYNGKKRTPSVIAKDSEGNTLKKDVDYTVKYASGRKNVGKYTIKVTFKGDYSGTKNLTFTILPKGTKVSSVKATGNKKVTVKWSAQKTQTSGYEIQYSTKKDFSTKKTKLVKSNATKSVTLSKLAKKTYYVRIRTYKTVKVNGKSTKIYSSWSSAKSVKVK